MCEALAWSIAPIELSNPGEALTASQAHLQPFAFSISLAPLIQNLIYFSHCKLVNTFVIAYKPSNGWT